MYVDDSLVYLFFDCMLEAVILLILKLSDACLMFVGVCGVLLFLVSYVLLLCIILIIYMTSNFLSF